MGFEMKKRELGNSGLKVAPLAFGGNVFGWTVTEPTHFSYSMDEASIELLNQASAYTKTQSAASQR
jgi:aryl-alcohol dehydrogenase-like predicted oxidoreductase